MNIDNYHNVKRNLPLNVQLIAVSKTKSVEEIMLLYQEGQRIFGENKAQEMTAKHALLPDDIQWHFIGHLQKNKVKYIAPFVSLIHSIDSYNLLYEVNSAAQKNNRVISCLLQFHIASEDSKFGFQMEECENMLQNESLYKLKNIEIVGVMGMATLTENEEQIRHEFQTLASHFKKLKETYFFSQSSFKVISMGMTDDYHIAIKEGTTMVRIGSAIFGH